MEYLTLSIAGAALLISFWSIYLSKQSNDVAKKSSEIQNRPWLDINLTKNKETGRYYEISRRDNSIVWSIKLEIKNIGSTPANNIKLPSELRLRDIETVDEALPLDLADIVLGHGEKYSYEIGVGGQPKEGEDLDAMLRQYQENDSGLSELSIPIRYTGLLDPSKEYRTIKKFNVQADTVSIIEGSEFQ